MSKKTRLKIGEFSQLMQVSVKALRYYEQRGLLAPDEVDEWTATATTTSNRCKSLGRSGFKKLRNEIRISKTKRLRRHHCFL